MEIVKKFQDYIYYILAKNIDKEECKLKIGEFNETDYVNVKIEYDEGISKVAKYFIKIYSLSEDKIVLQKHALSSLNKMRLRLKEEIMTVNILSMSSNYDLEANEWKCECDIECFLR